jgi:bifunctional polynucleotide phosphatase/kinase
MKNIIYHQYGTKKAAIFDLDHTLIKPITGLQFSVTDCDWEFNSQNVINKLKELNNNHFDIIILSNQKIIKNDSGIDLWKKKINKIGTKLGFPILALAALKDDEFRKPRTAFWDKFLNNYDKDNSFFCGDAGGLPKRKIFGEWIKKDFSDTDLKFALNVGIKFIHRDELFYQQKINTLTPKYPIEFNKIKIGEYPNFMIKKNNMIINVGFPGSGKSFYTKHHIKGNYNYINRDNLKTKEKCIEVCKKAIEDNMSIVIDNTNPSEENRKDYIDIGKQNKYKIICLNFITSRELSMHNNIYRSLSTQERSIVPKIGYNMYKSKYKKPDKKEGLDEIIEIDFILNKKNVGMDYYRYFF